MDISGKQRAQLWLVENVEAGYRKQCYKTRIYIYAVQENFL